MCGRSFGALNLFELVVRWVGVQASAAEQQHSSVLWHYPGLISAHMAGQLALLTLLSRLNVECRVTVQAATLEQTCGRTKVCAA